MADNNQWGSNLSFILAMIGSAVGLGNIWRYPYVLYSNGGGAFYIPYLVAILVFAIPFIMLEYGVGYNFQSSFTKAITHLKPKFEYFGWILPVAVFMMSIYYSTIIGWDGIYFILSFSKGWGSRPDIFLTDTLLQSTNSLSGLLNFIPYVAISMIIVWFLIWYISHRNLKDGLGRISTYMVPLLFVIMFVIVGYSLTLPGAYIGLEKLFHPNWSDLGKFEIWTAAFGQVFFSLSLGMGAGFTYASYTQKDIDLVTSGLYVTISNCAFENIAALGVFSILGCISIRTGTPISDLATQGSALIFAVYPTVFNILGKVGFILGPLFFLIIYFAGMTSIFSTFEVLSLSIQDKFDLSRKSATKFLVIIGGVLSMIFATSAGNYLLTITDTFINNIVVLFSVMLECIIFAWIFKAERLLEFLNSKSKTLKLGKWWLALIKYIIPILLFIIWFGGIREALKTQSIEYIAIMCVLFAFLLISSLILTKRKAKAKDWLEIEERIE